MSTRGDSGYMSNYSSIYSQNGLDSYKEDYYEDSYIDYNDTRNSLPTYNNRKYESSEYVNSRRSDTNYLHAPLSSNQQQYSTSPNSPDKYIQNDFSVPESSRRDLSPNSQNRKPSLPSSPRNGLPPNSPRIFPQHNYNDDNLQERSNVIINPPPRNDSSKNPNLPYAVGSNPRQYTSLPLSPKIQSYPHAETSRIQSLNNNYNEDPNNYQVADTSDFEASDIIDSYYDGLDDPEDPMDPKDSQNERMLMG